MYLKNKALPKRKSARLSGCDYSKPGAYFITVCTHNRRNLLGKVMEEKERATVCLSSIGKIVESEIAVLENRYKNIAVDAYVIMPNHVHLLLRIIEQEDNTQKTCSIPDAVGRWKAGVTRRVGKAFMPSERETVWQTSYYDHVVRGEQDYLEILRYIEQNPLKWLADKLYIP